MELPGRLDGPGVEAIARSREPVGLASLDFDQTPFTVVWEVTRSCDLRCVHCRASAQPFRDPHELNTEEGYALLDQIRELAPPVFVITGGDPLKRTDLFRLIERAVSRGLSVAVTPSGTPLLTRQAVAHMRDLGVKRMALSLDGPDAATHDAFRQQSGSFHATMDGLRFARECGLPTQINTTVTRRNIDMLSDLGDLVESTGAVMWSCFFLVTVGRASVSDQLDAWEYEEVFGFLDALSHRASFSVRTTAAPHFRRFCLQRRTAEKRCGRSIPVIESDEPPVSLPQSRRGVTDGHGIVFVSHTGNVYPSGFLPILGGSVRHMPLAEIYRHHPVFQMLRDHDRLEGKCEVCEFRHVCGGSRARAYAMTGNPMAADPCCAYIPRGYEGH